MNKWFWFLLSMVVVFADQITKYTALLQLVPYQPLSLMPGINLTLAYNSGAAFSFLSGAGGWHRWLLALVSFIMSVVLGVWLQRTPRSATKLSLAISLILGGALGNLYDRARYGMVVDFIDVYYQHVHWPVFNVADSAICLGALLLFFNVTTKDRVNT